LFFMEKTPMNARNENEKPADAREARTAPQGAEPREPEAVTPNDGSDYRETVEGGYGWGV
jgi:hypothetical protein